MLLEVMPGLKACQSHGAFFLATLSFLGRLIFSRKSAGWGDGVGFELPSGDCRWVEMCKRKRSFPLIEFELAEPGGGGEIS